MGERTRTWVDCKIAAGSNSSTQDFALIIREQNQYIRELNLTVKKLRKERDEYSFSRKKITGQWMDVLEDVKKEHEKEVKKPNYAASSHRKADRNRMHC